MSQDNDTNVAYRRTTRILVGLLVFSSVIIVIGLVLAIAGEGGWRWTTWGGLVLFTATILYGWLWGAPDPTPIPNTDVTQIAVNESPESAPVKGGLKSVRFFAQYLEPLFAWIIAYPLFPLQIGLFWAISWLNFGGGLGIPDLFWGPKWWMPLWVGASVSMLFGSALFIRAMLDRRPGSIPPSFFGDQRSLFWFLNNQAVQTVGAFLTRMWLPALAIFYAPLIRHDWVFPGNGTPGMMGLGLLLGVVAIVAAVAVFDRTGLRAKWEQAFLFKRLPGFRAGASIQLSDRQLHAIGWVFLFIPAFFCMLLLIEHIWAHAVWSPVWLFCLLLAMFNVVYGFMTFHLTGLQYALTALGVVILLVSNVNNTNKMTLPGLEEEYDAPMDARINLDTRPKQTPPGLIKTPDLLKQFDEKWTKNGKKPKLVVVATTGGGIQAAVWTAIVLEGLEMDPELSAAGFRNHIRLITGASGGMQAAALYTAGFENVKDPGTPLHRQLARDSLWPTAQTMMLNDIPGAFWPKQLSMDRGRRLEEAWERNCRVWKNSEGESCDPPNWLREKNGNYTKYDRSPLERTFGELLPAEAACDRPSLVFSPMLVEDCRRVMISNLELDWFTESQVDNRNPKATFPIETHPRTISVPALEFWRYFPKAHDRFKVGTAARMSATFPFVGPAVSLPTNPPRRVVDAGYFDNFGINFTTMWLHQYKNEIAKHTSGVVIVEIRAYPRREEKLRFARMGQDGKPEPESFSWVLSEASSPLEAIYNLYARSAYFRNDQLLQLLEESFSIIRGGSKLGPDGLPFFTTVTFECNQPAALSWTLPSQNYTALRLLFDNKNLNDIDIANSLPSFSDKEREGVKKSREVRMETVGSLGKWFTGKK